MKQEWWTASLLVVFSFFTC